MEKTTWQKNLNMVAINILKKLARSIKADIQNDLTNIQLKRRRQDDDENNINYFVWFIADELFSICFNCKWGKYSY